MAPRCGRIPARQQIGGRLVSRPPARDRSTPRRRAHRLVVHRSVRRWVAPALGWAARHGVDMGRAAPYPAEVACAPWKVEWSFTGGCVLPAPGGGQLVLPAKPQD